MFTSARTALGAFLLGLGGFWITAADAGWFENRPFTYSGPGFFTGNFVQAGVRGLSPGEGVLAACSFVFLLPAILVGCRALARATEWSPLSARALSAAVAERCNLVVAALAAIAAAGTAFVSLVLVRGAAMVDDERAYEFQAHLFARGLALLPAPPAALRNQMIITTPVWASKYPPGNSIVLAIGALVGDVRIVRPALAALLVYFVFSFVATAYGRRQGIAAAALTALSPFVWAQYGTLLAGGTTACACAAVLAGLARSAQTGRIRFGLLAGASLAFLGITRPHEAFALGMPIGVVLVAHAIRGFAGARGRLLWVIVGFASVIWLMPVHNVLLSGSVFRFGYQMKVPFALGFTRVFPSIAYDHSPRAAVANLVTVVARYDLWMLGFPGSMLLVLAGLLRGERAPFDALLAAMLGSFALCMALVFASGPWDAGPAYYFVCFPIVIALAVRGWHWCLLSAVRLGDAVLTRTATWIPIAGLGVCWLAVAPIRFASIAALCDEVRAPWEVIARAPYGDFLVSIGSGLDRRSPGWAAGYPYTIATGPTTSAKLFQDRTPEERKEAIEYLGPTLPVYRLEVDKELFDRQGKRAYALVPLAQRSIERDAAGHEPPTRPPAESGGGEP